MDCSGRTKSDDASWEYLGDVAWCVAAETLYPESCKQNSCLAIVTQKTRKVIVTKVLTKKEFS